jgi:hypothetical protein
MATVHTRKKLSRTKTARFMTSLLPARRTTSLTIAPGANAAETTARFRSSLQRRRRSGPLIS